MIRGTGAAVVLLFSLALAAPAAAQAVPPPVPKPFPGSTPTSPPPATTPAKPAAPATTPSGAAVPAVATSQAESPIPGGPPTEAMVGLPGFVPASAEYLESFDAGRGQRYYIYGTNDAYADVLAYYKAILRSNRELFKVPPMQQFDLPGKFKEETLAFPVCVIVKDYTWKGPDGDGPDGYLFVKGTTEKRFKTVIQIVPGPAAIR